MTARAELEEIARAATLLSDPGSVVELRALETRHATCAGYFDDPEKLVHAAVGLSGAALGVFITLNVVARDLFARAANRVKDRVKFTTSDADITARRWLLLDLDPSRPSGISATDIEHEAALAATRTCHTWLREELAFPPTSLVLADSGNGGHVLVRIDLPNDAEATTLVRRSLEAVALYCGTKDVRVDTSVYNAARISKLYGTLAMKGDDLPERPHRLARVLDCPVVVTPAPRALLDRLAALRPLEPVPPSAPGRDFDVRAWLAQHGIQVVREKPWVNGAIILELAECPIGAHAHHRNEAVVIILRSGMLLYRCLHETCQGRQWADLREHLDGRPQAPRRTDALSQAPGASDAYVPPTGDTAAEPRDADQAGADPGLRSLRSFRSYHGGQEWPAPLAQEALYGLAGDVVRTIEPATEADPAALLLQFLTAFGNVIARNAYFRIEADEHFMNLFVVLVGESSKARKGTSWGRVRDLFQPADADWAATRIQSGLSSGEGLIWAVRDPINEEGEAAGEEGRATGICRGDRRSRRARQAPVHRRAGVEHDPPHA
jgi:hypothetical protein